MFPCDKCYHQAKDKGLLKKTWWICPWRSFVDNNLHNKVILKHIFMKVSSILVICLIIKLQEWVVFRDIFSLNIKSNILAISVIKKLQHRGVFRGILSPNMKVSSILVINVINNLPEKVISRNIFSLNTKVLNILVVFVTKNLPVKII